MMEACSGNYISKLQVCYSLPYRNLLWWFKKKKIMSLIPSKCVEGCPRPMKLGGLLTALTNTVQ